jgi:hypothetical protein
VSTASCLAAACTVLHVHVQAPAYRCHGCLAMLWGDFGFIQEDPVCCTCFQLPSAALHGTCCATSHRRSCECLAHTIFFLYFISCVVQNCAVLGSVQASADENIDLAPAFKLHSAALRDTRCATIQRRSCEYCCCCCCLVVVYA